MEQVKKSIAFYQPAEPPRQLTQSIALEEEAGLDALNISIRITAVFVAVFIAWSSIATVNEVAIAQGQVIPSGYVQNVQHLEGGIVREILVEDGELVKRGQPLLRLDPTDAEADLGQMLARQDSLRLQASRLKKFADGDADIDQLSVAEQEILSSMEQARASQQQVIGDQILQKEKEFQAVTAGRIALEKNLKILQSEYDINKKLANRGSISKMAVMATERELNALEGELSATLSRENQALAALNEATSRLQSLGAGLKQEAMKNLGVIEAELAEIEQSIAKLQSASNRTVIEAPVDGVVKGLTVNTLGSVVEPGKTILELVPVDKDIVVEAMVSPTDIGNLQKGQKVNIKITAYDFARFGSIEGKVEAISASTFQNEKGQSFYKTKIRMEKNYIGNNPEANSILPGMIVQADIITGQKTILEYLLKPIQVAASTAFHER